MGFGQSGTILVDSRRRQSHRQSSGLHAGAPCTRARSCCSSFSFRGMPHRYPPSEPSVPNDAVAGNQQRHRIGGAGARDGAGRGRLADRGGDLLIRARLAVRDRLQLRPRPAIEMRSPAHRAAAPRAAIFREGGRAAIAPARSGSDRCGARSRADTPRADSFSSVRSLSPIITRHTPRVVAASSSRPSGESAIVKSISTPGAPLRYVAGVMPSAVPARS